MLQGIGSVLAPPQLGGPGILNAWLEGRPYRTFRSARAALAELIRVRNISRIWLPAYICASVVEGINASGCQIAWYGTNARLEADISSLSELASCEAVLCVDYFGRSADAGLRALATSRPDVLWIEDRAQAMQADCGLFGDVVLYSPRKLFGVGDGGLIAGEGLLPHANLPVEDGDELPHILRAEDPKGFAPEKWFSAFRAREANISAAPQAMSSRTMQALEMLDWQDEAMARKRNWSFLAQKLNRIALWADQEVSFAPLAYPIIVRDAGATSLALADLHIWCARHWANLPSPEYFREAHLMSSGCLSLPLDGRYGLEEMERISSSVLSILDRQERSR